MKLFGKCDENKNRDKATDKLFLQSFVLMIVGALIAITALSTSTWAWFVGSTSSDTKSLMVASCEIDIYVTEALDIATISEKNSNHEVSMGSDEYTFAIEANKKYSIKLVPHGTATTCYCIVVVDGNKYLTRQINVYDEANMDLAFEFTITSSESVEVSILKRWGTAVEENGLRAIWNCENYEIVDGTLVTKSIENVETKPADEEKAVDTKPADEEKAVDTKPADEEKAVDTEAVDVENILENDNNTTEIEETTDTAPADVANIGLTPTDETPDDVELTADSTEAETEILSD